MNTALSSNAAAIVAKSLPLVERHRAPLTNAITGYMRRCGPDKPAADRHQATTRVIMDMLLDHAREIGGSAPLLRIEETARRHRLMKLTAAHYSCFGDALGAAMKSVLGDQATPELLWGWGDGYWSIVRATLREHVLIAA